MDPWIAGDVLPKLANLKARLEADLATHSNTSAAPDAVLARQVGTTLSVLIEVLAGAMTQTLERERAARFGNVEGP